MEFCKAPKLDAYSSQSVTPTNCHKAFLKVKNICIMIFRIVHWDNLDDNFTF